MKIYKVLAGVPGWIKFNWLEFKDRYGVISAFMGFKVLEELSDSRWQQDILLEEMDWSDVNWM